MKPHRLALTHNLVLNYNLYKKMEVRSLCHAHTYTEWVNTQPRTVTAAIVTCSLAMMPVYHAHMGEFAQDSQPLRVNQSFNRCFAAALGRFIAHPVHVLKT